MLVESYKDVISGRVRRAREAWSRLLEDAQKGLIDAVVIYDITRAGRKAGISHQMADELVSLGLELHSALHGHYDFSDEAGAFRFGADALYAQVDYRPTVKRLYDAKVEVALAGRNPHGTTIYGIHRQFDPDTGKPRCNNPTAKAVGFQGQNYAEQHTDRFPQVWPCYSDPAGNVPAARWFASQADSRYSR